MKQFCFLQLCFWGGAKSGADWMGGVTSIREESATAPGGIMLLQAARFAASKSGKKQSVGPDVLGFTSKINIIHKKHMFFDKKYILFSPH